MVTEYASYPDDRDDPADRYEGDEPGYPHYDAAGSAPPIPSVRRNTAIPYPDSPSFDMRSVVWQAVILHGEKTAKGILTADSFALAISRRFDMRVLMGREWCEDVLRKVHGVTKMPGPGNFYKHQTG